MLKIIAMLCKCNDAEQLCIQLCNHYISIAFKCFHGELHTFTVSVYGCNKETW